MKICDENACGAKNDAPKDVEPIFGENAVTVAMAANDNYVPYCGVLLRSIIDNSNPAKKYDIIIISSSIDGENKKLLESMSLPNVYVRVINFSDYIAGIDLSIFTVRSYFSVETYFRFFIPELFKRYSKIIYLDCDMVVLRDIADLYEIDIGSNWWGVTHESNMPTLGFNTESWEYKNYMPYVRETLKVDNPFDYFQAGVMVWNIAQCNEDGVTGKLIDRLAEIGKPYYVDQDVMNSVARGKKIYWISGYWNVPWYHKIYGMNFKDRPQYETILHWTENPFILHYAGGTKPWWEPERPNAHYFWQYARNTPFYEKLLNSLMLRIANGEPNKNKEEMKVETNKQVVEIKEDTNNHQKRKITFKKMIKFILPYGFIRFYQMYKYH